MKKSPLSIRDLAKMAGVSATTASAALRGSGRMKESLRARIQKLARDMGYSVDPIVSAGLARIRQSPSTRIESVLAWLNATPEPASSEKNLALRHALDGATEQARELGYHLEQFWLHEPTISETRLAKILYARGIEGVIVAPSDRQADPGPASRLKFDFEPFACVSVTTKLSDPVIDFAQADHFACTELALRELHALGYRRIALVGDPSVNALTRHRIHSAYAGFVSRHADMKVLPVSTHEGASANDKTALMQWLKKNRPDAVLGWKSPAEFRSLGFRIPDDFGVCVLDYFPSYGDCAGVDQHHQEIGKAAVRLVQAQLRQGIRGVPRFTTGTLIEGSWIHGSSVPRRPLKK